MVPAIGIKGARIVQVGKTKSGQQAVTPSLTSVFHWRDGVIPGHSGSAVLAAHTCHFLFPGCQGVFQHLVKLHKGDIIKVRVGKKVSTSKVTSVLRHVKHRSHAWWNSLYRPTGPSRLVLITCGDPSNRDGKYHSHVVVRAKKVTHNN